MSKVIDKINKSIIAKFGSLEAYRARLDEIDQRKAQTKPDYSDYYTTYAWQSTRQRHLQAHPLDEYLGETATEVHHLVPFSDPGVPDHLRTTLLTDPDNLLSVTPETHKRIHRRRTLLTDAYRTYLADRIRFVCYKHGFPPPAIYYKLVPAT